MTTVPFNITGSISGNGVTGSVTGNGTMTIPDPSPAPSGSSPVIYASQIGCHLDSNLSTGGGTDDTATLQNALNQASAGKPIHLVIDGPALTTGLKVYGNTILDGLNGGGLYLANGSNAPIIQNANFNQTQQTDFYITIKNLTLNGNRAGQADFQPDGFFVVGMQFGGATILKLQNLIVRNTRKFAIWMVNSYLIQISDCTIIHDGIRNGEDSTDGIHLNGPLFGAQISNLIVQAGDDAIAINANDGPQIHGDISDVNVDGVYLWDCVNGPRVYCSDNAIDRVTFNNIVGTVKNRAFLITHYPDASLGNLGSLSVSDVNITIEQSVSGSLPPFVVGVDLNAKQISLQNIMVQCNDSRPLLWGNTGPTIQNLYADLKVINPPANPFQIGGTVAHKVITLNGLVQP